MSGWDEHNRTLVTPHLLVVSDRWYDRYRY